jgi:ubiquinone/menaquinone biosynthesis C-methylase UbiE
MAVSGLIFIGLLTVAALVWLVLVTDGVYFGKRGVRFIYQRVARVWTLDDPNAHRGRTHQATNASLAVELRPLVANKGPIQVLDVATGTGRIPLMVAAWGDFEGHVTGVDLSRNMLAKATSLAKSAGLEDKITFVEGDAADLRLADNSFDVTTCIDAPLPNPSKAIRQLARVTKPGGTLVLTKRADGWAGVMPGKVMRTSRLIGELERLRFEHPIVLPWLPSHDLIVIAKKGNAAPDVERLGVTTVGQN